MYEEPKNSIDVAVIGASSAYEFWNTMEVWNEYHVTSFDLSGSGFCAASAITCMEEFRKTQEPKLVLVEVRTLLSRYYTNEINIGTRNIFDSIDYSINRMSGYLYFAKVNDISPSSLLEGLVDIVEYHDNYDALSNPLNWQLADNRNNWDMADRQHYKGYCPRAGYNDFDSPEVWLDDTVKLDGRAEKILEDIISYCGDHEIALAFFASPLIYTAQDNMEFNAIADICGKYNVPFFNGNKDFSDTGMNFSEDFYDPVHANLNGSVKFTSWLADKVFNIYGIKACKDGNIMADWNTSYDKYAAVKSDGEKAILEKKEEVHDAAFMSEKMKATEELDEWLAMGMNKGFTVFTCCEIDNFPFELFDAESKALLKGYGIDERKARGEGRYLSIWRDSLLFESTSDNKYYEGVLGSFLQDCYKFYWDGKVHLHIDKQHFDRSITHGEIRNLDEDMSFIAFNYYTNEIFDVVTAEYTSDGNVGLSPGYDASDFIYQGF